MSMVAATSDVDLYGSDLGYRETARGAYCRDELIHLYGRNRWYLSLDADEFLVFPRSETRPVAIFYS